MDNLTTTIPLVVGGWILLWALCSLWRLYRTSARAGSVSKYDKVKGSHSYSNLNTSARNAKKGTKPRNVLKYSACDSPECVRCQKYQEVRSEAYSKLITYVEKTGVTGLDRLWKTVGPEEIQFVKENSQQQPNVLHIPQLNAKPVWENSTLFSEDKYILEQNFETILWEFMKIYQDDCTYVAGDSVTWITNKTPAGRWSIYSFYNQGYKLMANCRQCPKTTAIVEALPCLMKKCLFGNVCFSVLHPGTHIEEHYGPTNARIRCHLGLQVPQTRECYLTIDGENLHWKKGKCILFDDSFQHSASFNGPDDLGVRVVLMIDFWHPDLSNIEKKALQFMF